MYKHLDWANHRILEKLQNVEANNQQVKRLFCHILHAEQIWIARIKGIDSSQLPIWSEGDLAICANLIKQNKEEFAALLAEIDETQLDHVKSYANSKGNEFTNSMRDILTHVALHGQYHRGQINSQLRAEGIEPINTDFITFIRKHDSGRP